MKLHLYEILWDVETDATSFLYSEFKVLSSRAEAKQYGKKRECKLNGGASIEQRAHDGYCFKYLKVCEVREIGGYKVQLACE